MGGRWLWKGRRTCGGRSGASLEGQHVGVGNPIESTFATVRHRTGKTKGCLSRKTGLAMAFRLMMSAQVKWRKLDGAKRLPEIVQGIAFKGGIKQLQAVA